MAFAKCKLLSKLARKRQSASQKTGGGVRIASEVCASQGNARQISWEMHIVHCYSIAK